MLDALSKKRWKGNRTQQAEQVILMINKKNFIDLLLSWYERQKLKEKRKNSGGGELIENKIRDVENGSK
jgi:hypothetical protein